MKIPDSLSKWGGLALTVLPALALTASAGFKLQASAQMVEAFTKNFGFPAATLQPIGIVELLCVALFVVPRTAVLGAILLTGYLGGAIATHVRMGEAFVGPLVLGILPWVGLWLRDARIRAILPLFR